MDKGGRPRIEIDMGQLKELVSIQCTAEECAQVLGVSVDTIDRRLKEDGHSGFAEYHKNNSGDGRASLRRLQWAAAKDGNPTMLVWLGKQYLGQKDKVEASGSFTVTLPGYAANL